MRAEDILPTYERVARGYARSRDRTLFERKWLDRMLAHAPGRDVLDLGCGTGLPIAHYLSDRRANVTGIDGAAAMVALFRQNLPGHDVHHADMRGLDMGRSYDAVLAWNSFFHLSPDDQRAMFPVFAAHCGPRAVLMFTAGPHAGEPVGQVEGEAVYHASLDPDEYRDLLAENGFQVLAYVPEDPDCRGHTIWLARRAATA